MHHTLLIGVIAGVVGLAAVVVAEPGDRLFDLSQDKGRYWIGYAQLDTQWRWDFATPIDRYNRDTLEQDFDRCEECPGCVVNFIGSVRYGPHLPEHRE